MFSELRSRGVLYSAGIVFNRLIPEWLFRARIMRIDALRLHHTPRIELDNVRTFRASTPEEFAIASSVTEMLSERDRDSTTAWVAEVTGEPVGGVWQARRLFDEPELGLRYKLASNQTWLFAAQVVKSCREQGIYRKLLDDVLADTTREHLVALNPTNRRTMKAHRHVRELKLGHCFAVRFLSMAFCITTGSVHRHRTLVWDCHTEPIEITIEGSVGEF